MMKPEKYLRGAFGAWEMLIDFPLPAALRARLGGMYGKAEVGNVKSIAWFVCRKESDGR